MISISANHDIKRQYFETLDERNIDSDILGKDAGKGYWGYLRNLYINFDFFCELFLNLI